LSARIHTSCSQPIGPGLVRGDFEVVAGRSRNGGPLCPLGDGDDAGDSDSGDSDSDDSDSGDSDSGKKDGGDSDSGSSGGDDCGCEGKVSTLTLRYLGDKVNAHVRVLSKRGSKRGQIFSGVVQPGETFTIVGPEGGRRGFAGTLGTEIMILVNRGLNAKIHTSCSQPIGPGLVRGDFEVVAGESRNAGPLCPIGG